MKGLIWLQSTEPCDKHIANYSFAFY